MARVRSGAGAGAGKAAAGILKPVFAQLRKSKRLKTAGNAASTNPAGAAAGTGAVRKNVVVGGKKYPESAKHIRDAQAAGHPKAVTINRPGTKKNRAASLKGYPTRPGKDRDEYPPAMFKEGGTGASVRHIDSSDNQGAGASMGNQVRGLPNGTRVRIVPK